MLRWERMKIADTIYLNPTYEECAELSRSCWDTIRVCEDEVSLALASGFGHTHQCVINAMRKHLNNKRWHPSSFILYHSHGAFGWNLEDVSGKRFATFEEGLRLFEPQHRIMLKDLISCYPEWVEQDDF